MMKPQWRLLKLPVNSYAEATMSLSPAIARACEEGAVPETLAMFTHLNPSIVMGRQNDPDVDINYDFCKRNGISVKRVPTPGTIYGHSGYVMNALYIKKDRVPASIPDVFAMFNTQLASALSKKWGLEARHRPINDLEVKMKGVWKKVGPFSISFFGPCICCRMGMTISPMPYEIVEQAVPGPPEKFADKDAKSVTQRVGSLEEALGRPVEVDAFMKTFREAVSDLFEVALLEGELSELERSYQEDLNNRYDNEAWFLANTVRKRFPAVPEGAQLYEHVEKIPHGPLVRARVLKRRGKVLDCSLTGWYHGIRPLDALERVESSLREVDCIESEVQDRIQSAFEAGDLEIGNCRPSDFVRAVLAAVRKPPRRV